jgi:hypothetical protein
MVNKREGEISPIPKPPWHMDPQFYPLLQNLPKEELCAIIQHISEHNAQTHQMRIDLTEKINAIIKL